jgi:hypothetical protein
MPHAGTSAMLQRQEAVDNIVTNTWYDVRDDMFTDIWDITPLMDWLNGNSRIKKKMPNGRYFELNIGYDKADQNNKWFGRGDTFSEAEKQLWTRLQYPRRNFGDSIVRYWDDEQKNKGKAAIRSYSKDLIDNHKQTMRSTLASALWTTGGPLAINTLPELITTTPTTGVVGGIDRANNGYLRNNHTAFSGTLSDDLIAHMRTMWNTCSLKKGKGRASPDMIITTQALHEEYEEQCEALGQIQLGNNKGSQKGDLGFGNLSFKGAPVMWDPECPAGQMYFINSDTIEFVYDPDAWMEMTEWKHKHNGLDRYAQVITVCNLLFNNFQKNGVISALA